MTDARIRAILQELIDENPLACRAILRVLHVEFTRDVPTLAVTCETLPRLRINAAFVAAHCRTDAHVKAVILHELLHVLLRHTQTRLGVTPARHLACDAVINAIIARQCGEAYSSMMSRYYATETGLARLLRRRRAREVLRTERHGTRIDLTSLWDGLYAGTLVADDIEALAHDIEPHVPAVARRLIGNHAELDEALPSVLETAVDAAFRQMNGAGIWRSPRGRGSSAIVFEQVFASSDAPIEQWRRATLAVFRRHIQPDARGAGREAREAAYTLPVLSPSDRRAFLRARWSPLLPDACWATERPHRTGSTQVYLDVSGSMWAEMPEIVALIARLRRYVRQPLWAFSDIVAPAIVEHGHLKAETSGGTSLTCVLRHVADTRPAAAVIVTDGYVEPLNSKLVAAASRSRLHVIVTRDGDPALVRRAGLPWSQLDRMPS
ncbi:MAG: hypothetical protein IT182_03135 [Acidobacteria bacterium]|nr:hypothetical protein [Acidobacteriota bacterium]